MEFQDFKERPQELVGKKVHLTTRYYGSVETITKVGKASFQVTNSDRRFRFSGYECGNDPYGGASCKLLTDKNAAELTDAYIKQAESKQMRDFIGSKLMKLTHAQLMQIMAIIDKK